MGGQPSSSSTPSPSPPSSPPSWSCHPHLSRRRRTINARPTSHHSPPPPPLLVVIILVLLLISSSIVGVGAVRYGDEQYSNSAGGSVAVFSPGVVRFVNPHTGNITQTIKAPGASWGDMVFMMKDSKRYVFATDGGNGDLWVLDADTESVVAHPHLGSSPEQVYALTGAEAAWVHLDQEAVFSVVDIANVSKVASTGILARSSTQRGHGKLAFDPSVPDKAYASNTGEGRIFQMSIKDQRLEKVGEISLPGQPACTGTDGISFNAKTNRVYVECGSPGDCELPAHPEKCTGALWEVGASTLKPTARLVSPSLSAQYQGGFGLQGHPWESPNGEHIFAGNKRASVLAILRPHEDGTDIIEVPCDFMPGRVVFWKKPGEGGSWGPGTDSRSYVAVISLEASDPASGVAFLDMEDVVAAFEAGEEALPRDAIKYLTVGAGGHYRPIARGADFIFTPTAFDGIKYPALAIIDAKQQVVARTVAIDDISRVLWVPSGSAASGPMRRSAGGRARFR